MPFDGFDPMGAIAPFEFLYAGGASNGGALRVERGLPRLPLSRGVAERVY